MPSGIMNALGNSPWSRWEKGLFSCRCSNHWYYFCIHLIWIIFFRSTFLVSSGEGAENCSCARLPIAIDTSWRGLNASEWKRASSGSSNSRQCAWWRRLLARDLLILLPQPWLSADPGGLVPVGVGQVPSSLEPQERVCCKEPERFRQCSFRHSSFCIFF